ncbi:MAG: asparagine synthetase B [Methanobrevibacter olleyae]|uniref:Putative asparagine synthetase [glutamine-hydrolyzing] n=1 Tax=Methanobrevibacter olleyae TaxID=294671 RepID=A0A8T3VNM2_METOL|nr:asparagine synthetase B [Methanobrevibacter olleyae]
MCGIVGMAGNFNKEILESALKSIDHRGKDYSNAFIDEENSLALGHNLLSIFNLIDENNGICDNLEYNKQPIILNNLVLVFNGEIYNFNKLEEYLIENDENYSKSKSDSQILANLISFHYNSNDENLLESVKYVIKELDADYSFAVYDMKHDNLAISRDSIGVKPLFYGMDEEKDLKVFASEKKALWKAGITDENIHDLTPGCILYNWETVDLDDNLINKLISTDFKEMKSSYKEYDDYLKTKDSYEVYKELLIDGLYSAVEKRVDNISNVGLIFSGGVDSTILAVLLKQIAEKRNNEDNSIPLNIKLYSVGVEKSQDIVFSKDMANELDLPIKTIIIDENAVKESIKPVLTAIEDDNLMKLGVGMTIYLAAKAMKEDDVKVALSGQGADELFGGYNRYLKHFEKNSLFDAYFALDEEIYHDIANMHHVNLERDDAVSMANGVELRVPFLDKDIINLALDIPGKYKIRDNDDILRKHILRDVAKSIGVPDHIADRPKKAAQYGSGINKILKKRVLKSFDMGEFIDSLKDK